MPPLKDIIVIVPPLQRQRSLIPDCNSLEACGLFHLPATACGPFTPKPWTATATNLVRTTRYDTNRISLHSSFPDYNISELRYYCSCLGTLCAPHSMSTSCAYGDCINNHSMFMDNPTLFMYYFTPSQRTFHLRYRDLRGSESTLGKHLCTYSMSLMTMTVRTWMYL